MEGKICPIMAQGFIVAHYEKTTEIEIALDMEVEKITNRLPKCLKEKCGLWIETTCPDSESENKFGYCGLINQRIRTNWSPV